MPENSRSQYARLNGYDYSSPGAYFVTLVANGHRRIFGEVLDGDVALAPFGKIAHREWFASSGIRKEIELFDDEFIVMPNHIHGIVWITEFELDLQGDVPDRATGRLPGREVAKHKRGPSPKSLGSFVGGYKSSVTHKVNQMRNMPGKDIWTANFHDRVIRNQRELNAVRRYIAENPLKWELDRFWTT